MVFTDIEDSTPRWEADPDQMRRCLSRHDAIVTDSIESNGGVIFKRMGDGMGCVFTSPEAAADAAIEIQRRVQTDDWEGAERLRVRIGIHMGELEPTGRDYFGPAVNRAARIMAAGNGDQIAMSALVSSLLPKASFLSMGDHQLRGIGTESIDLLLAPDLLNDDRPLRAQASSSTKRLPVPPNELIGRGKELEDIAALLGEHQSVTIVGPGGVGKTHLSIEIGHAVAGSFPDGVILCELVPLSDGDAVADAVAESLGARAQPGMSLVESILNFLESRQMLLILDNCEHVADAVRDLGSSILKFSNSQLLATSREPVGLEGEQLFGLLPLEAATSGVELFLARASERDHSFNPAAQDRRVIVEICERLDGIPLGIELAAAWTRVLAPSDLLERLDDRFQVLRGGRAGGRHQTLRDTVQWSYEQLDETQANLFDRLSVFAGGFSLDAVEAVCADDDLIDRSQILDTLMALVDKSMVMSTRGSGHIRFAMLGTLRQYGQERLDSRGESEDFRVRHAAYFRQLALSQSALLISAREADVWDLLDRDWSNLRTAFDSMLGSGDVDGAVELLLELGWFAALSMRFEAFTWAEDLFAKADVDAHPDAGSLHGLRALLAYFTVDSRTVEFAHRGLALDPADRHGYCRIALSAVSLNNELSAEDSEIFTAAWLESLDDSSPMMSRVWAEGMRTFHICSNRPSSEALVHADKLMAIAVESGSATAMGLARWAGGLTATFHGVDKALDEWRKGIDTVQSLSPSHLGYHLMVGLVLHFTASHGDLDAVVDQCLDTLEQAHAQHYVAGTSHLFGVTAIVLCRLDRPETGGRLLGAMEAHGHKPRANAVRAVDKALGADADRARSAGASLSTDEAATMAMDALRAGPSG